MENKKRAANFSTREEHTLVSLVKKYKYMLENKKTDTISNKKKLETWNDLANEFNGICGEVFRDSKTLKSKYENLKKRTKEKFAAEKATLQRTGGGPPEEKKFSQIEYEIKDLIGIQLTGAQSMFDGDRETNQMEILDHDYLQLAPNSPDAHVEIEIMEDNDDQAVEQIPTTSWAKYTPELLRTPKSTPLVKKQAYCQKNQLCSKVTQWANTKKELADIQKQCYLEEHHLKMEMLREAHAADMRIKTKMLEMLEEKHKLEVDILKGNKN